MKKILPVILVLLLIFSSCIHRQSINNNLPNNTTSNENINNQNQTDNKPKDNENTPKEDNQSTDETKETVTDNEEPSNEQTKDDINVNAPNLSNKEIDFGPPPIKDHKPQYMPKEIVELFKKYDAYYLGDTSKKEIYLTFDEGYENGYTSKILDILKEKNVKAAFFVTRPYILQNKELIKRMVEEGHIVANHSSTHPSMPQKALDFEKFKKEFEDTEIAFKEVTGQDMPKFFRPPMGKYSELSLYYTQKLGYKTIFWSFAHKDWLVNEQPPVETTIQRVLDRCHNGEIMLLHAVSKSNTEALPTIIDKLQEMGYEFKPLTALP
ncbi:delta-lactam-biosynthetic de-N-acetylase [Thermobrachium celere]|uniref:Polysaccharide deacetylase n=1 Tax=Thermobrachium celere DSM 8682 TaxID=941824 RepID=R7RR40_9CLOT|nr:delta-lactam-biosynthetic de-N-acetylase [Thermobrachium celere]CDF57768.1 Polysaccharide deacetylase [Thermobrachium celere DSM 8682]